MSVVNGGFETAAGVQGQAAGWTFTSVAAATEVATFAEGAEVAPWESFEDGVDAFLFGLPGSAPRKLFGDPADPRLWEAFESGWFANLLGLYFFELATDAAAVFQAPAAPESFEAGWANVPYVTSFAGGGLSAGAAEDFEAGWANAPYDFTLGSVTAATFGLALDAFEAFEAVYTPVPFTVDPTADTLVGVSAFGLAPGDVVYVVDSDGSQLPAPLSTSATYYVAAVVSPTEIQLSQSVGLVPVVDVADFGEGVNYLIRDPAAYWPDVV